MSVSEPGKIITPWAESGLKSPIPPAANPATGRAGFDQGFSAINMAAKEAGGIPPFGQDFNGIFYEVTNILRYMQAGGQPTFDAALATAIGGYPKGAMVLGSDGVTLWQSKVDSNSTDPNIDPANWGTFDIGLKGDLAAPGGSDIVGFQQAGAGSVPHTSQDKMMEQLSAADFQVIGDGVTNDDAGFVALEAAHKGRRVDLLGREYLTTKEYTGNEYFNGSFRFVVKLLPDAEFPETRIQTREQGVFDGYRSATPSHVKSGLKLATIKKPIQGAALDYYDNILYTLEYVDGDHTLFTERNKIVAYRWHGQDVLTPIWETLPSLDVGHQSIGHTIGRIGFRNTRGALQLWGLCGSSKTTDRHEYLTRFTPTAGGAIVPEFFHIWDSTYDNRINTVCTDPTGRWLITTAKRFIGVGTTDMFRYYCRVYDTNLFINPDQYGHDYRNLASIEFEMADFERDFQAIACDGKVIYACQAGSAYSSTRKFLHMYSMSGSYLGVQQIQAGAGRAWEIGDPGDTGTPTGDLRYEPEALFMRAIGGGYDLVFCNTNGVPSGETERETSFYTLMPQQAQHIKTTSSVQPGQVIDAAIDVVTPSGNYSIGKVNSDGSLTEQLLLNDGGINLARTMASVVQYELSNSLRHVTYHISAAGDTGLYDYTNNKWLLKSPTPLTNLMYIGQPLEVDGPVRPFVSNVVSCGTATRLWTQVYAFNTTINNSDGRLKSQPLSPEQMAEYLELHKSAILDAWGDVKIIFFQWLSDIQSKGEDVARWHAGVISQQVRDALLAHGVDGTRFGLLCYDEWEDEYRPVMAWREVVTYYTAPEGEEVREVRLEEYDTGEKELVNPAGDRWSIRPTECLWLEAAYQRRNYERVSEKLLAIEERLSRAGI